MANSGPKPNEALKQKRKEAGLTLEALAHAVGLSTSQISRFESGKREPRLLDLQNIARELGCPIEALYVDGMPPAPEAPIYDLQPIKVIGKAAAGVFREVVEFNDLEPEYVFEPADEDYPQARRFSLEIAGESMDAADPPIRDGARVVCVDFDETGLPFLDGMTVALERLRDGGHLREWTVKEIELHDDEVWFCPRSTKAEYKPIKVPLDPQADRWNSLRVMGLVRSVVNRIPAGKPRR